MCWMDATLFRYDGPPYLSTRFMKNSIVPAELSSGQFPAAPGSALPPTSYQGDWGGNDTSEEEEGSGSQARIKRYWAAIKRFWWLVAGITALGTAVGVLASRGVKPTYEAHGSVFITLPGAANSGPFVSPSPFLSGSWIPLIKSFKVIDRVVAQMHLWYTPKVPGDSIYLAGLMPTSQTVAGDYTLTIDPAGTQYTLSEFVRGIVERGLVGDSIGRMVGFAWVPPAQQFHPRQVIGVWIKQPRAIAAGLLGQIDVATGEQSNVVSLSLAGPNKVQTAGVLNAWMQAFQKEAAELHGQNTTEMARTLQQQVAAARNDVTLAEDSLQTFRAKNMTKPGESVSPSAALVGSASDALAADFFKTQSDYDNIHRDRLALGALSADAAKTGNISPDEISGIPSVALYAPSLVQSAKELVIKQDSLRQLRQTLQDSHPKVQALLSDIDGLLKQTIPTQASNAAEVLGQREAILASKLKDDSTKLTDIPARSVSEARLRRNVADKDNIYTNVEARYEAARLGSEGTLPDVQIMDYALPSSMPQKNVILLLMVGGFAGSFGFSIVLVLLLDMIDPRFRYPEQITHELKLDVLGAVPAVPKAGDTHSNPDAMAQSVEAFRSLRMNLHHEFDAPPVLLTVTSPGAGDGKSMVASNLALSFSEAGYRTLLIDGDIRRGKLHSVFGVERRPGLLDYLAGDAEPQAIFRDAPMHSNLTIIPGGTRRHRGPELLTSARLPALLNMVRSRYDVILMDSAPLAAGVDAYALGVATGSIVLVMRTGVTDRRVAKAKLKLVERLPIRLLGAVVNSVPGTGLYTEYSYLYGYSADADPEAPVGDEVAVLNPGSDEQE